MPDCTKPLPEPMLTNHQLSPVVFTWGWFHWECWRYQSLEYVAKHYNYVIIGAMVSQITSLMIVYSTLYSGADQRKHQSSVSLAFVREIHWGPVNSPHKWPVTRKMFPFDDVIMILCSQLLSYLSRDNKLMTDLVLFCQPSIFRSRLTLWMLKNRNSFSDL